MSKESSRVKKEKPKDDTQIETRSLQDRKSKKTVSNISTPRSFVQKSSATDIYVQVKKTAPKKTSVPKTSLSNRDITPKKGQSKSSSSTLTARSDVRIKLNRAPDRNVKANISKSTSNVSKKSGEPITTNITVNSPVVKRKLFTDGSKESNSRKNTIIIKNAKEKSDIEQKTERHRSKTRTLDENEIKLLTPEVVDNNAAMLNLTRTLTAKPKSFYIDLDENGSKERNASDEDVSYEDDFESYESDFESYHSEAASESKSEAELSERHETPSPEQDAPGKDVKDEEKMLDSGNFELHESQRSANISKPAAMEHIREDLEDGSEERRSFLTDEGFQEMSSGSATSSMKIVHVDTLDRPLFIDFSTSKRNKDKKRMNERIKQRAKDILNMVTLHEMSYVLFEMKPIPYDLYMATFGRSNYTQIAVQTYDDSVTEEIQTDELTCENKWTQHPVEFSKNVIELKTTDTRRKTDSNEVDYLSSFAFLIADRNEAKETSKYTENGYIDNPLRIYFEQKDGVGCDGMLPYEKYKMKLGNDDFCVNKLGKFLKKSERRLSQMLSRNAGDLILTDLVKHPKCHFSVGYSSLMPKIKLQEQNVFLKQRDVIHVVPSDTKNNLLMTIHEKSPDGFAAEKCLVCLWDLSVTREPLKILIVIDNIVTSRFRGGTDGIFVAALEDGSIHLWDLTETPTWFNGMSEQVGMNSRDAETDSGLTQTEKERECNLRNSLIQFDKEPVRRRMLQACAYTTSAKNMVKNFGVDEIVGLEITVNENSSTVDSGRRITGQVVALQRIGILTLWNMVQDKNSTADIGKAYWSKIKLECYQTLYLADHVEGPKSNSMFNLNAAKRRLTNRRRERSADRVLSRDSNFKPIGDSLTNERNDVTNGWDSGVICNDLRVTNFRKTVSYLVAKNCGEILCCVSNAGAFRVTSLCVATDTSSITCLEVSPHGLPFFLAGTDSGALHLYSLLESRVLITLDSHANPVTGEKCHADHKGRFIGTSDKQKSSLYETTGQAGIAVQCAVWSRVNPCCIYTLSTDGALRAWDLSRSDIVPQYTIDRAACRCVSAGSALILLTPDGDVQIHKLPNEQRKKEYLNLFKTYAALL